MFKLEKEQKVFDIAGVKLGGKPGEYPTVLIGSIFYDRHKIVSDPVKGEFDRSKAESLIAKQDEMSNTTGNSVIVDVVGTTSEALIRYLDFVSEKTKAPFLVDGISKGIRISAMKHLAEIGLMSRAIYNSIDYTVTSDEIAALRVLCVKSSVLLANNPKNAWPEGRLDILRGSPGQTGLLEAAAKANIANIIVDTAVFDVPSIGLAAAAINLVKKEMGLPAGCGPSNAVTCWRKARKEMGPFAYPASLASSCVITQMKGANFVLYGPIEQAETVFPACAVTDAIIAYANRQLGVRPQTRAHPLFKIF